MIRPSATKRLPKMKLADAVLAATLASVPLHAALANPVIDATVEAPRVQNTTASFNSIGIETFNSDGNLANGIAQTITTSFPTTINNIPNISGFSATISGVQIVAANQYGGAGGTGYFGADYLSTTTVTLNQNVNYFGLWFSAANAGNLITLYNNAGTQIYSFDVQQLISLISGSAYYGNPNALYQGQDPQEPFAFINFFDTNGTFNKITLSGPNFEFDNMTVGSYATTSGTLISAAQPVPEPSSFASLAVGIAALAGMAGFARRARSGGDGARG